MVGCCGKSVSILPLLLLCLLLGSINCSEDDHVYKAGDKVALWVNKIGPYHNPQETYEYSYVKMYICMYTSIQLTSKR